MILDSGEEEDDGITHPKLSFDKEESCSVFPALSSSTLAEDTHTHTHRLNSSSQRESEA